jgi:para-nitrobenzyl esterase
VYVFIHGGANAVGSITDPLYDGRALAEAGDLIVVTINYRVGQLGFLAHASLAAEGTGSGDFGLLDQIAALRWVHDNIAAFGGDPANVTIGGESAGARDVCSLVASPMAAGLFGRAIMESGSCKGLPDRASAESAGASYATAAGCTGGDVASCLRALPLDTALKTMPPDPSILVSTAYQPAIDGAVQTGEPAAVIAAGAHNHVDFVVGANADETGKAAPAIPDEATYDQIVKAQFGPIADQVLAQYPASSYPTPRAAYVRLTTDARFVCPSREIARAVAGAQSQPVYRYFFAYAGPSKLGAVHGLELPFVFDTFGALMTQSGPYQPTQADLAVSTTMQGDWTRFARTGDPGGSPAWPRWDSSDPTMVFAATPAVQDGIRTADCDFWKPLYDSH